MEMKKIDLIEINEYKAFTDEVGRWENWIVKYRRKGKIFINPDRIVSIEQMDELKEYNLFTLSMGAHCFVINKSDKNKVLKHSKLK